MGAASALSGVQNSQAVRKTARKLLHMTALSTRLDLAPILAKQPDIIWPRPQG